MRALLPLCLSVVGCQYGALEPVGLSCDAVRVCPSGFSCSNGHCAAPTDAGSAVERPCLEASPSPTVMEVGHAQSFVSRCEVVVVGDLSQDRLQLIDPGAQRVIDTVVLRADPTAVVGVGEGLWVASSGSAELFVVHQREVARRTAPGPITSIAGGHSQPLVAFLEGALVQQTSLAVLDDDSRPTVKSSPTFVGHTPLVLWDEARGRVVSASDATVRSWSIDAGTLSMTRLLALDGPVTAMALRDDGALAVAAGNAVVELDVETLARRGQWPTGPRVVSLVFSSNTLVVATQTEVSTWVDDVFVRVELPSSPQCPSIAIRQVARSAGGASLFVLADCGRLVTKSLLFRVPMPL